MRNLAALAVAAVGLVAFTGCETSKGTGRQGSSELPATDEAARAAGLSDEEIAAARKIYVTKCARCHKFYNPAEYDDAEWPIWMIKMSKKARLKPEQDQLLSRYLEAFRAHPK